MSLITRCPACQTMFRVVPDQLRISEGWVRCGQCDEIFDASIHLVQTVPEERTPSAPVLEPSCDTDTDTDTVDLSDVIPSEIVVVASSEEALGLHAFAPAPLVSEWTPEPEDGLTKAFETRDEVPATVDLVAADEDVAWVPEIIAPVSEFQYHGVVEEADAEFTAEAVAPVEADEPKQTEAASFLRGPDKTGFWHQRFITVTLLVLGALLCTGLAGQVVFQERDRIAAMAPELTPWLETLCRPFSCSLSPLRHIESIAIESSSFTNIRGDAYALSFTLKNAALTSLARPSIELTLTDSADQPVVRRVFQPSEFTDKSGPLTAGAEWSTQLAMVVKVNGVSDKVVGYRLLAFYP